MASVEQDPNGGVVRSSMNIPSAEAEAREIVAMFQRNPFYAPEGRRVDAIASALRRRDEHIAELEKSRTAGHEYCGGCGGFKAVLIGDVRKFGCTCNFNKYLNSEASRLRDELTSSNARIKRLEEGLREIKERGCDGDPGEGQECECTSCIADALLTEASEKREGA